MMMMTTVHKMRFPETNESRRDRRTVRLLRRVTISKRTLNDTFTTSSIDTYAFVTYLFVNYTQRHSFSHTSVRS